MEKVGALKPVGSLQGEKYVLISQDAAVAEIASSLVPDGMCERGWSRPDHPHFLVSSKDGEYGEIWGCNSLATDANAELLYTGQAHEEYIRRIKTLIDHDGIPDKEAVDWAFSEVFPWSRRTEEYEFANEVLEGYLETALWASKDSADSPLDETYSREDLNQQFVESARTDVKQFIERAGDLLKGAEDAEQIGHDFWLTRNHHGAGFWDGPYPKEIGKALTDIAHQFQEVNLYIGDDKKIWAEGGGLVEGRGVES